MAQASRYLIALGSNMRHPRWGRPRDVVMAALVQLDRTGAVQVLASSRVVTSAPVGPSRRRYANAAAIVATRLDPEALLVLLQAVEQQFGRSRRGQRWGARVLDLDIVLGGGGSFASARLIIPHPEFRRRTFVTGPAAAIAADWRDPVSGLSVKQLHARLTRPHPAPR